MLIPLLRASLQAYFMSGKEQVQEAINQLEGYCRGLPRDSNSIEVRKQVSLVKECWMSYKRRQKWEPVRDWLRSKRQRFKTPHSYSEQLTRDVLDALIEEAGANPDFY